MANTAVLPTGLGQAACQVQMGTLRCREPTSEEAKMRRLWTLPALPPPLQFPLPALARHAAAVARCQDAALIASAPVAPVFREYCEVDDDQAASEANLRDGAARYLPYVARAKLLVVKAKVVAAQGVRYMAYTSDLGESFRPVLKPWQVNLTYGVAAGYCLADSAYAGYCVSEAGEPRSVVIAACAQRGVFQFVASLALPAVIIHTVVHQAQPLFRRPAFADMPRVAKYGPSGIGLAIIPFLPLMDPACEHGVDWLFDKAWPGWRGSRAQHSHSE